MSKRNRGSYLGPSSFNHMREPKWAIHTIPTGAPLFSSFISQISLMYKCWLGVWWLWRRNIQEKVGLRKGKRDGKQKRNMFQLSLFSLLLDNDTVDVGASTSSKELNMFSLATKKFRRKSRNFIFWWKHQQWLFCSGFIFYHLSHLSNSLLTIISSYDEKIIKR